MLTLAVFKPIRVSQPNPYLMFLFRFLFKAMFVGSILLMLLLRHAAATTEDGAAVTAAKVVNVVATAASSLFDMVETVTETSPDPAPGNTSDTALAGTAGLTSNAAAVQIVPETNFFHTVDDRPASWDPCSSIRWTLNTGADPRLPADIDETVHAAVARLADVTGLRFVYVGPTDAVPDSSWWLTGNAEWAGTEHEGNGYAPLNIAFVDRADTDLLPAGVIAEGGAERIVGPDGPVYVSGSVLVNLNAVSSFNPGFVPGGLGALLLHELGHAMGLDHTDSTHEIMHTRLEHGPGTFGPGDIAGLTTLSSGSCLTAPPNPHS